MRATFLSLLLVIAASAQAATPAIDAGGLHGMALKADGTLLTWGDDSAGQLGLGRTLGATTAIKVNGVAGVAAIAAGSTHVVALTSDGSVWTWGDNGWGQLGDGTTAGRSIPARVAGLSDVVGVAAGDGFSVALTRDGNVWTWGENFRGQLGDGSDGRMTPGRIAVGNVTAISAGNDFVLALKSDGTLWGWGSNDDGQLGNGSRTERYIGAAPPAPVLGISGVDKISAGGRHVLARKSDGTLWAWGSNEGGAIGDGSTVDRLLPVQVSGIASVAVFSAGTSHNTAVKNDGSVWVWGSSAYGQLGDDTYNDSALPKLLPGLTDVIAVSTGFLFTIAVRRDGSYYAWGHDDDGELGDGSRTQRTAPILVPGPGGLIAASVGAQFTAAVSGNGIVYTWGDDSYGQLGDSVYTFRATPAPLASVSAVTAISAGGRHSLALKGDGTVLSWGLNNAGQLGYDSAATATPTPISGLSGVSKIAAGGLHSLALKPDGTVLAWGYNFNGALGNGTNDSRGAAIAPVSGVANVTDIAAGGSYSVFLIRDGSVVAVGANASGQLGDGTTTDRYTPVVVAGLSGVTKVSAGDSHTLALKSDGSVWAWGANGSGQVGDGTLVDRAVPVRVALLDDVTEIAAGDSFSLAVRRDGTVWAWGANYFSQLGDGTGYDRNMPAPVPGLTGVAKISAGGAHAFALRSDGSVFTWGRNNDGQLGDGTLVDRDTSVVALRENGAGTIAGNDWFLDLDSAVPSTIPPDRVPVFQLVVAGQASQLTAEVRFRAQDVNTTGSVFVFALAPAPIVKNARAGKDGGCVLAQLGPNGELVAVSASTLQPVVSGILNSGGQAVTIINGTNTAALGGATFFVGYGPNAGAMISNGTNRSAVTVPGAVPCPDTLVVANVPGALSGLWWNASESGWGVHFTQRGTNIFAAWYTYNASGSPKWFVSTCAMGGTGTSGTCNGAIYEVSGPTFFGAPFNPQLANAAQNGNLSVNFQNADNASMTYSGVSGQTRTVAITRQPLGTGSAPPAVNYTDIWWGGASESGWGLAITQQFSTMFLAWYVYDGTGKPIWYVATCTLNGTTCSGALLNTTGPAFGATFDPNAVHVFTAGTVSVSFTDGNNAMLSYTVNGVSASKTITRQLF